jgi:hypothetical protein
MEGEEIQIHRFLISTLHERVVSFTPRKYPKVPNEQETGWVPEPVWTFWEDKNFSQLLGIWQRYQVYPALHQSLYWLSYKMACIPILHCSTLLVMSASFRGGGGHIGVFWGSRGLRRQLCKHWPSFKVALTVGPVQTCLTVRTVETTV